MKQKIIMKEREREREKRTKAILKPLGQCHSWLLSLDGKTSGR